MRFPVRPWQLVVLLIAGCAGALALASYWRSRGNVSAVDLAVHLPPGDSVLLYADIAALRRYGILDLLAGSKAVEDSEYKSFVEQSGFEYRNDLDTLLASFQGEHIYLLLGGRFDWKALGAYTARQGGTCLNSFCRMPGSRPERSISYFPLRPRMMALAASLDVFAATQMLSKKASAPLVEFPQQPVWLSAPASTLRNSDALPTLLRPFAGVLRGVERIVVSMAAGEGGRFDLRLEVNCREPREALLLAAQLQELTAVLQKASAGAKLPDGRFDFAGMLAAGSFRYQDRRVEGSWPLARAFFEALAGGAL